MKTGRVPYAALLAVAFTMPGASSADDRVEPRSRVAEKAAAYVAMSEESDPRLAEALAKFKERQLKLKESGWKPPWEGDDE